MKSLVIANWKMNPETLQEAKKIFEGTKKAAEKANVSLVIAPPAIFLRDLSLKYRGKIGFALQHGHEEISGAHTGDISLAQAKDAKVTHVLIGHAERRAQGETNDDTRKKVARALSLGMTPILCVGEKERTISGDYFDVIREQLQIGLAEAQGKLAKVVIVYEPTWAIGKQTTMPPSEMHSMSIFIRKSIVEVYGEEGHVLRILYGGSVDAENVGAMREGGDVAGFLVGRASLDAAEFGYLLQALGQKR